MRASAKRAVHVCCVVASFCFLGSCAHWPLYKITVMEIPTLTENPPERIPLRAGFFMDDKSEDVGYFGSSWYCYQDMEDPSKKSMDFDVRMAFEQATRRMFQEVVPITATETSKDWKAKNLDVVVSVGPAVCEARWGRETLFLSSRVMYTTLSAEWSIVSQDGKTITSVRPAGEGEAPRGENLIGLKKALVNAVDAHIRKVYDSIVMSAWWRDSSWKSK
jgi:hypothetical protein